MCKGQDLAYCICSSSDKFELYIQEAFALHIGRVYVVHIVCVCLLYIVKNKPIVSTIHIKLYITLCSVYTIYYIVIHTVIQDRVK